MYIDAVGPSLRTVAELLDADWATLLFAAGEDAVHAMPVAVLARRVDADLVLEQRADLRLPVKLIRWLRGRRTDRAGGIPAIPRTLRHDGAGALLALPLVRDAGAARHGMAILILERRGGLPFSREEAALVEALARRIEPAIDLAKTSERARSNLDDALAALSSGRGPRDAARATLEAIAMWAGAEDVAMRIPPVRVGAPGIIARRDREGAFTWDEGEVSAFSFAATDSRRDGAPDIEIVPPIVGSGGARGGSTVRAVVPIQDGAVAALDVTWAAAATALDVARLAAAARAAVPFIVHLGEHVALGFDRERFDIVVRTIDRITKAPDVGAALRALLEGATKLAGVEGASIRLERGVFGASPAYVNIYRAPDGSIAWSDVAVAADEHTSEALRVRGSIRVVDLAMEAETGNVLAQDLLRDFEFEAGMIVPICARGHVVGTLRLATRRRGAFDGMSGRHLQALADHAGAIVEQAILESEAAERLRRLNVAQRIAAAVNTADDGDGIARRLLEAARAATGCSRGEVALVDADGSVARTRARTEGDASDVGPHRLYKEPSPDEDEIALTVRVGTQWVRSAASGVETPDDGTRGCTALTPIVHGGKTIGVMSLTWDRDAATVDLAMLGVIAEQAGGAVARAQLAQAERAARSRLTTGLEASSTVIIATSPRGAITRIEGDTAAMLGLPPRHLLETPFLDLFVADERATDLARALGESEGAPRRRSVRANVRHEHGRHVPVLVVMSPRYEGGRLVGAVAAMTDLTEIAALTDERDTANAARSRAEGAVRTGRAIAHDLGSPLSSILALSEMLVDDVRLPEQALSDVGLLSAEAVRASALLHRFGRITRYEEQLTPIGPQLDVEKSTEP